MRYFFGIPFGVCCLIHDQGEIEMKKLFVLLLAAKVIVGYDVQDMCFHYLFPAEDAAE